MPLLIVLALLSCLLAGCGSDSSCATCAGPAQTPPSATSPPVWGRVVLDRPLGGATVELFDLQGQLLGQTTTDASGRFKFAAVPRDFRVVASGANEAYAADYREFDGTRQMVVNPLTNLLATYRDRHPEVPAAEARARIKRYFGMPPEHELETHMVQGSRRPGFSVRRYLEQARASQRSDSGATTFVAGLVEDIHTGNRTRARGFSESAADWLQGASDLGAAVGAISVARILGGGFTGPSQLLIGWVLNSVLDGLFSPTSSVALQLQTILNDLGALANEVNQDDQALLQQISTQGALSDIAVINTSVTNYLAAVGSAPSAANVVSNQFALQTALTDLASRVGGTLTTDAILSTVVRNATQSQGSATWLPLLANTNSIGSVTFGAFNAYANLQTQGIQMLVDILHAQTVPQVNLATVAYDAYCQALTSQQNLIPRPLDTDNVIFHPPTGLIFYKHILAADTPPNAMTFAATFQEGNYRNWRVMTLLDMTMWLQGGPPYNGAQGVSGITATDLQNWGFDITNLAYSADFNFSPSDNTPKAYWGVIDCGGNYTNCPSGGPQSYFFGSGGIDGGGGGVPWGLGQESLLPYQPYVLVCDAGSQDRALLRDLGQPTGLSVDPGLLPAGLQAYATYTLNRVTDAYTIVPQTFSVSVTDRVAWSVNPSSPVRIQTWPAGAASPPAFTNSTTPPGFVGPYGPGLTTFYSTTDANTTITNATATITGSLGSLNQTVSVLVNPSASPSAGLNLSVGPRVLTGVRITPRSQFYGTGSQPASGNANYPYTVTAYFLDGTFSPVTSNITWSITNTATNTPFTGGAVMTASGATGSTLQLNIPAQSTPAPFNLTLSATALGLTDSTVIQITPPLGR